jgi:pepF/M3 family oligoendopeptidase
MEKELENEINLPIWSLNDIYQSFNEFNQELQTLENKIEKIKNEINNQDLVNNFIAKFLKILNSYTDIFETNRKLNAYLYCILSCDSTNEEANKYQGKLLTINSTLKTIQTQLESIIFQNKDLIISNLNENKDLKEYEYFIKKSLENFEHKMTLNEEELYNLISISSNSEWKSLYDLIISNIKITLKDQVLSISQLRNLYHDKNRTLREIVYKTELKELEKYHHIFAKILNSIKWDSIIISKKRKFNSLLEATLFYNRLDLETFNVILNTTFENLNIIRKYFKIKAKLLNLEKLEWYDIFAPINNEDNLNNEYKELTYNQAKNLIINAFQNFSDNLSNLAKQAFDNNWIDAKPRLGKSDGGFCIYVIPFKSRILVNYDNSIKSVFTLAHELGHAFHNYLLSNNLPIYRNSPLILAETASLLAENILRNYINNISTSKELKITILDGFLLTVSQVVIDILSRFLFEKKLVEIRKERTLSANDLINLMLDSQQEVYLDSINSFHKYMWIVKPHYYHSNFYNYPYLIGLLISLSLYQLYLEKQINIKDYEEILTNTGKENPYDLLIKYNINIKQKDFWEKAFEFINKEILEFEELAN